MAAYADVPVEQRPSWQAYTTQEPFHIHDWSTDARVPARLKQGIAAQGLDVGPLVFVPLTTPHRRLGALGMSGSPGNVYSSDDISFLRLVGRVVAFAIDDNFNLRRAEVAQRELQRQNELLQRSERERREVIETIPSMAWSAAPDGSADFFNQRWLAYAGLTAGQAQGWGWTVAVRPDDLNALVGYWREIMVSGRTGEVEARLRRFDGVYRWFLFRANPVFDASGNVECWYGTNIDIEDRKQAEQVRADAEQQLKTVIDTIPAHVWRTGPDGENDFINQARIAFGGGDLTWHNFVHPDDAVIHRHLWAQARETGQPFEQEMPLLRTDGVYRWFLVRVAPQRNDDGAVARWFGTNTDIDDLKQAQERVRRSEQDLRDAIDTIPTHVWSTLPDGSNIYLNRRRSDYGGPGAGWETI